MFEDAKNIVRLISKDEYERAIKLLKKTSVENIPATLLYIMCLVRDGELDVEVPVTFLDMLADADGQDVERVWTILRELGVRFVELRRELKS